MSKVKSRKTLFQNLRKKWYTKGIKSLSEEERYLLTLIEPNVEEVKKLGEGNEVMEEYIKEAVDVMDEEDLLESYDKELALKQEYFKEGKEEGYNKGKEDGIILGVKESKIEMAKSMLKDDMPVKSISKYTKLSVREIEKLRENKSA